MKWQEMTPAQGVRRTVTVLSGGQRTGLAESAREFDGDRFV
ncbi:MAG TPA: hypothetical protein VKP30_28640 [Polyangiaceae bacterium]|nr:hypothetical protein [Polyangiaceae bacterium]